MGNTWPSSAPHAQQEEVSDLPQPLFVKCMMSGAKKGPNHQAERK